MPTEEWRPISGFPGYEVSSLGRVVSHRGREPREIGAVVSGYLRVRLSRRDVAVHALVAAAFIGPRPEGQEVRHLNGNPLDNRVQNLAYGTHSENMQDSLLHGTHPSASKTHCPQNHPYEGRNLYMQNGHRVCRICKNARQRAYKIRAALRAAGIEVAA